MPRRPGWMLHLMGFGPVDWWDALPDKIETAEHHPVRGYLRADGIEGTGRVVGLVYLGHE